jgi:hypothetical protein
MTRHNRMTEFTIEPKLKSAVALTVDALKDSWQAN